MGRHEDFYQNQVGLTEAEFRWDQDSWVPAASLGEMLEPLWRQMSLPLHSILPLGLRPPIYSIHEVVGRALGTLHLSGPPWSVLGKAGSAH